MEQMDQLLEIWYISAGVGLVFTIVGFVIYAAETDEIPKRPFLILLSVMFWPIALPIAGMIELYDWCAERFNWKG